MGVLGGQGFQNSYLDLFLGLCFAFLGFVTMKNHYLGEGWLFLSKHPGSLRVLIFKQHRNCEKIQYVLGGVSDTATMNDWKKQP